MIVHITSERLREIAQELDAGMKCFYHIASGELKSYPDELKGHAGFDGELWEDVIDEVEENFHEYISFQAMESHDSFKVMESFVTGIEDKSIHRRFEDAISYKKPFQNFKQLLYDYPDMREAWFKYKELWLIEKVQRQLDTYNSTH
jgi:hypothetical protein